MTYNMLGRRQSWSLFLLVCVFLPRQVVSEELPLPLAERATCSGGVCSHGASNKKQPVSDDAPNTAADATSWRSIWRMLFRDLTPTTFFHTHWQQKTAVVSAGSGTRQRLKRLLPMEALDFLIDHGASAFSSNVSSRLTESDLKMVKRVRGRDGDWWSGGLHSCLSVAGWHIHVQVAGQHPLPHINSTNIHALFGKGFSMILNRVSMHWPPLAIITTSLAEHVFGYRVNANLYFTPPGTQAFEAHFDWMESFVVQFHGEKDWKVYEWLLPTPRASLKFKPSTSQVQSALSAPAAVHVVGGDVLYLPAGVIHEAAVRSSTASHKAKPSLHITFGVEIDREFTWEGLLHGILDRILLPPSACEDVTARSVAHVTLAYCSSLRENVWLRRATPNSVEAVPGGDEAFGTAMPQSIVPAFRNAVREYQECAQRVCTSDSQQELWSAHEKLQQEADPAVEPWLKALAQRVVFPHESLSDSCLQSESCFPNAFSRQEHAHFRSVLSSAWNSQRRSAQIALQLWLREQRLAAAQRRQMHGTILKERRHDHR